jgi:recombination protein RecT
METTNAVAKQPQKPVDILKGFINAPTVQEQFQNALGNHKDTFVASLIDLFTGDKALQTCKPGAIVSEALRAATMKLPLNKALGFAYVVVYNNKRKVTGPDGRETWVTEPTPTFIPGYKGYIQLAMRTGEYKSINADVVYEGELTKTNKLTGEVDFGGVKKSDKIIGYFCYFELLNGFAKTLYMSVEDMAAYAKRYSKSISAATTVEALIAKANDGIVSKKVGWEGNFNDMAIKTVVRRLLSKYGYLSVEMQSAMSGDIEHGNDAVASRNDMIADAKAEKKTVELDESDYEIVDAETGEIKAEPPVTTAKAQATPNEPPY